MTLLVQLIRWEIAIFLAALAGTVAIQLLTGQIKTTGLLQGRISGRPKDKNQYFSPERLQLLIFTLGAGFHYLTLVLTNPNPGTFPSIPQNWPAVVGGSNVIYLAGKAYSRWLAGAGSGAGRKNSNRSSE
ncbi:MAG TPA: hypothetical protein VNV88_16305 [Candidatus Solibacter sp.]|jgi:hypothetical protein|nr:hypothetical protein [Candidatus Solibacter sp.]